MTPKLSIIIVSFNTVDLLRKCLKHVCSICQGLSFEIIVIDNASKDKSFEMVKAEFPQVRTIKTDHNVGFGPANNIGFELAKGEFILLLNSDAFPAPETIKKGLERMEQDPKIGYGGSRLTNPDGSLQPSGRLFPSFLNIFLEQTGLADRYENSRFFWKI